MSLTEVLPAAMNPECRGCGAATTASEQRFATQRLRISPITNDSYPWGRGSDANSGAAILDLRFAEQELQPGAIAGGPAHLRIERAPAGKRKLDGFSDDQLAFGKQLAAAVGNVGDQDWNAPSFRSLDRAPVTNAIARRLPRLPVDRFSFHATPLSLVHRAGLTAVGLENEQ